MQKVGEITAVSGEVVEVTFCRPQDCEHCHACEGGQTSTVIHVSANGFQPAVGDYAAVELPTATVVKASLLAYVLPLAGLIGGMMLGSHFRPDEMAFAALGGLLGLLICLAIVWGTEKARQRSAKWQPTLVRLLPGTNANQPADSTAGN